VLVVNFMYGSSPKMLAARNIFRQYKMPAIEF